MSQQFASAVQKANYIPTSKEGRPSRKGKCGKTVLLGMNYWNGTEVVENKEDKITNREKAQMAYGNDKIKS